MNNELLVALAQYFEQFAEADDDALLDMLLPILEQAAKDGANDAPLPDGIKVDWQLVNENAVTWAKDYGAQLVSKINDTTRQTLAELVSQHLNTPGATLGDLQEKIQATMKANEVRARLIAQTEITRAFAQGNLKAWQESGAIEKKRWRTNNDSLVCEICAPLNGKVVELNVEFAKGLASPPAHPGCRCWVTPVVEI